MLYHSDFPAGSVRELGRFTVTAEQIVAFATEFDPQPMHLDAAAASQSLLGGLAASGWHTAALMMRMICDAFLLDTASLGSPGMAELRWLKPVRAGDVLLGRGTVLESRVSQSRPGMGICRMLYELRREGDGATVMTWDCTNLVATSPESFHRATQSQRAAS